MPTDHTALTEPQLLERAERLYRFVQLYADYMQAARDYGTGELISMVEVHTLTMIADSPGITVTELAQMWDRTKGAVSQNVKKLEQKGLILKKTDPADTRRRLYYPTPAADSLKDSRASLEVSYYSWLVEILSERDLSDFIRILDILYRRSKEARKAGGPAELLDQLPGHTERDD